jgi:hypothetical protein
MYETIRIPDYEVFSTGTHNGDTYTLADLEDMVKNSELIGTRPIIKLGHGDAQEVERPALGYVERLRIVGTKLVGDLTGVPAKLGAMILAGQYGRNRSAEIFWNFVDGAGKTYRRVFKAIALLGETWPAVTNLKPIKNLDVVESLYSKTSGLCYDDAGRVYKRYELPLKRKDYSIKPVGNEFHVVADNGLTMGAHSDLLAAERQRKELTTTK